MPFRRRRSLTGRLRNVLQRNTALLQTVNEQGHVTGEVAEELPEFLDELRKVQLAVWSAAAADSSSRLIRLAQPVDTLVSQWSAIADALAAGAQSGRQRRAPVKHAS